MKSKQKQAKKHNIEKLIYRYREQIQFFFFFFARGEGVMGGGQVDKMDERDQEYKLQV